MFSEETGRHAGLTPQPLDENDVALVDHVELFGIPSPGKGVSVHRLAVPQDPDEGALLPVAWRPAQSVELGEGVELAAENPFGFLASNEAAPDAIDVPRFTEHRFLEDSEKVGRKDNVPVNRDDHGAAACFEGAIDSQSPVPVIAGVNGNVNDTDRGILCRELFEGFSQSIGTRRVRDNDFECPCREILPGQAFEAYPKAVEIAVTGHEDGNSGSVSRSGQGPRLGPEPFQDSMCPERMLVKMADYGGSA